MKNIIAILRAIAKRLGCKAVRLVAGVALGAVIGDIAADIIISCITELV